MKDSPLKGTLKKIKLPSGREYTALPGDASEPLAAVQIAVAVGKENSVHQVVSALTVQT